MNVEELLGPEPQDDPAVALLGPMPEAASAPEPAQPVPPLPERLWSNAISGLGTSVASMIEGVALAPTYRESGREELSNLFDVPKPKASWMHPAPTPLDEDKLFRFAQHLRSASERVAERNPQAGPMERFLAETLPSSAGSIVGFGGVGALLSRFGGRTAPLGAARGVALSGAAAGAGDAFTDAKRHGADDETALFSAMVGAGLGATEAVPIAKWLAPRGGGRVLMRALREGSEEMIQEFVQQLGNNVVAEQQFDPGRPWIQGAGEGAAAGLTLGTLGSLLASVVGGRKGRGLRPATSSTTTETTDTPIEKAFEERLKEQVGETPTATPPTETTAPVAQPPVLPTLDTSLGQDETTGDVVPTEQSKPVDIAEELLGPPPVVSPGAQADLGWGEVQPKGSVLFPPPTGDDPNIRVRKFANQLAEEPTVSDVAKGRIANALYRRRPQEDDIAMAKRLIDEAGGPEQAVSIFNDQSNDVHPSVRTFMGEQIIKDLGAQAREAETKGDAARADQLINRQVEFIDTFLPFTSESGYRLGNLAVFSKLSPRTHVARYKKLINQNKKEERQAFVENVEQAKQDLAAGASPADVAAGAEQRTPSRHRKKTPWKKIVSVIQKTPGIDTEKVWNAVAPGLGLPAFDPKAVKRITKLANEAASKPEGFQQDRAVKDLMTFVEQSTGDSLSEFLWAIYYARLLSGPPTHLLNIGSNTAQMGASYLAAAIQHPTDAAALGRALISGLGQAVPEIADVLKTGRVTGVRMLKAEPAGILERTQRGGLFKLLKHWRVVARAMAAEDLAAFMPLHEMRSVQLAREQARKEGLKGQAFHDRVAELLGQTPANVARAKQVATSEGHKGLDYKRRVDEFQRQQRDPRMRENARDYALRNTFNSKPYGLLGDFASALKYFNARHPWMRVVTPFIDVMANVANEGLNYTPLVPNRTFGAIKAMGQDWRGKKVTGQVYGRDAQHGDAEEMIFKQIAGMGLMGLLGQMIAGGWDKPDDEKWIDISGPGPTQPEAKDQLRATGWLPFSIRIGGKWFPYSETQVGMALGALGTYFDAVRYKRLGDKSELSKLRFLVQGTLASFGNRTSIKALSDFLGAITSPQVRKDESTFKALGRLASGVLSSRLTSFFDRLEDPKAYEDTSGFDAALMSNTAVVRRLGKPKLNVFGEPVMRKPLDRFLSSVTDDRLAQTLAKRNIWIPLQTGEELGGSVYRPFTADEQYRFVQLRGPALRQALTRVLPTLNRLETAKAQSFARAIIEAETLRAKAKVVAERGITRKER